MEDPPNEYLPVALQPTAGATIVTYEPETTAEKMVAIRTEQLEMVEKLMVLDVHYGRIPGTPKPTLYQPGAQLLDVLHGFAPIPHTVDKVEDFQHGYFSYTARVDLIHRRSGTIAAGGLGSCNSGEKKYRDAKYRSGDDAGKPVDPRDILNTLLKMAVKRAHIAATLNATGLTDYFTQDLEDMKEVGAGGNGGTAPYGLCPIHNKQLRKGTYGLYCPTKVTGTDNKERWCKGTAPGGKKPPATAPKALAPSAPAEGESLTYPAGDQIKNLGQLYTAALNFFGLSKNETLDKLDIKDATQIADPGAEWEKLVEKYQEQGE